MARLHGNHTGSSVGTRRCAPPAMPQVVDRTATLVDQRVSATFVDVMLVLGLRPRK